MVYDGGEDGKNSVKGKSFTYYISTTKTFQLMKTA